MIAAVCSALWHVFFIERDKENEKDVGFYFPLKDFWHFVLWKDQKPQFNLYAVLIGTSFLGTERLHHVFDKAQK